MGSTPFLALTTNNAASGSLTTFYTWRLSLNDETNSNATKVDTFAQNISASVVTLQGQVAFAVEGTESTTNNYVATVSGFSSYTDGRLIILTLNVTNTGTTTLNINSLGTKSIYKMQSNGVATNISSGDIVAGRPNVFTYDATGGYWLWANGTSADQINISGNVNNIPVITASGIVDSGISASSLSTNDGAFVVTSMSSNLRNEFLMTAGSGTAVTVDSAGSKVVIDTLIIAGSGISVSNNTSSSKISIVNNIISGSGMSIEVDTSASKLKINTNMTSGSGTTITTDKSASTLAININASSPLSASGTNLVLQPSGVISGSYNNVFVDSYGRVTSGSVVSSTPSYLDGWIPSSSSFVYYSGVKGSTYSGSYTNDPASGSNITLNIGSASSNFYVPDVVVVSSGAGKEQTNVIGVSSSAITVDYLSINHTTSAPMIYRQPQYNYVITGTGDLTSTLQEGMKVKLTQTTDKFFYVTKVTYSSPLTYIYLFGGTDYEMSSETITNPHYSINHLPYGFPAVNSGKWTISLTSSASAACTPSANEWWNLNSLWIIKPIGTFKLSYLARLYGSSANSNYSFAMSSTLSSNPLASSNNEATFMQSIYFAGAATNAGEIQTRGELFGTGNSLAYYLLEQSPTRWNVLSSLSLRGDWTPTILSATVGY